ncbi:MAG TPA: hypothetical protein VFL93_12120 [Longimicrobiaceae bacterium]|jgi:hypothetical protein|nr:hypothetical protein [Longimicrobiaceae bacterium]
MFWLFVTLLWAAMLLSPLALLFLFLPSGRACPRCAAETVPIQSRLLRPLRRIAGIRWCMACGWQGVARHGHAHDPLPSFEVVPEEAGDADDDAPWKNG